ncbi:MAG: sensor histidine kinase [Bdellovibrionota bacterium]
MNFGLPINVLLIDDDEDDHMMFRDLLLQLRGQKFKIDWRSTYDSGREALASGSYDVCFMDYRLGGRTGLELLREAVADGCKVPIILLTGYGEQEVDLEAMRLGAADYLVKDQVSPPLLERSIRYAIHRARALQAVLDREAQILVQDRLASVGLLASSLAHEIGTPLGVIRGRAEYIEIKLRDNQDVKKSAEVIISQIDRVSKLIRSLLNLARGDGTKKIGQVSFNEVFQEVMDLMGHELRKHEIELRNQLASNILVKAESGPLHQVLLNLLVNSVHAIESGKRSGENFIQLSSEDLGDSWGISVADSGCGISEANMKNIFQPFFTTKDIGAGTGLGLATSYRIVESWGGSITVESKEGQGAEFRLALPKA